MKQLKQIINKHLTSIIITMQGDNNLILNKTFFNKQVAFKLKKNRCSFRKNNLIVKKH